MNTKCILYFSDETVTLCSAELCAETVGRVTRYTAKTHGATVLWSFEETDKGVFIDLEIKGESPLGLRRIDSLRFVCPEFLKTDRILFFSNNMRKSEHRYPCELAEGVERDADCTGIFPHLAARGTAIAMVAPFTYVVGAGAVTTGESLEFFAKTEFTEGMLGETCLRAERVFLARDILIDELYDAYRSFLPKSTFPMPKLIGWNTWDYYLDRVTPEDIFENIGAMSKMPFADKLDYIVIDDGWQKEWGEWVENEKFACGLDHVAKRIREEGFLPGIWMAPLLIRKKAPMAAEHVDWFCRGEDGELIVSDEGATYVIDPTIPEAADFIINNYKYLYAAGYRLFKIDYLSPLLHVKSFHDPEATPYSALRELIMAIRRETGPDAVILGCSLPIQCGADIAPSMRIGVDIHNHFGHVKWISESLTWSWMYNNVTTRIDPDFLIVRGKETADEELKWEGKPNYTAPMRRSEMTPQNFFGSRWRQGDQFNAIEAETWSYIVAISGGNIFLSDRMSVLNERGIKIIENAFNAAADECRPRYLEDDERLPSVWEAEGKLLLVNWEDKPVRKAIACDAEKLISDKEFSLSDGVLEVTLLPHESFFARVE